MNNPPLPHSLDAEQSVLGGLMLDNDRWDDIATIVSAGSFYSRPHGLIFTAMQTLLTQGKPIDLITLSEAMEQQGTLEQCGGFAYLAELAKNTPSAANIVAYAEYVASYGQKRQLLALGHDVIRQAGDVRSDLATLLEETEQRLFTIAEQHQPGGTTDLPTSLAAFLNRLEQRCGSEDLITGTPTGFNELNEMTSGFQPSDFILLAGRPSMGKTAMGLSFCEGALSRDNRPVQIYSLEMPTEQLLTRFVAMLGRVPMQHLRSGNMDTEDWARVSSAMKVLLEEWKDRLIIDDASYMTPALLRSRVRKNVRQYGQPSLILLDYLQLMRCPGQENRTQEIAEISRSLKALAKEIDCPVVALSQLNRALESRADKRPNNGDLRDSGALEQDADLIMFVYRDEIYDAHSPDKGVAEIILGKQRNGPVGIVKVSYQAEITRFEDFPGGRYDF
ncbi:replicative DNA helicase [Chimaeribacter californicus]|uniref:Replicative DNA helicase n=1 Tax=Chimaeribacter californicus TaxID=2060067 RepID=A0A2N5E2Y2_9GAMM|nr:SPI-7-type island replicative DNA helicase [Chimaeribacter californicus]PLR35058.1 replicative DNA helicase [Chimaeribacter californicus]